MKNLPKSYNNKNPVFKNPPFFSLIGSWLFHCHFLYHIVIGMNLILQVGTQADLPPVPPGFPTCGDHLPQIPIN